MKRLNILLVTSIKQFKGAKLAKLLITRLTVFCHEILQSTGKRVCTLTINK